MATLTGSLTGTNDDPEYRRARATRAARARHSLDTYIDSIERRADELTPKQLSRLEEIVKETRIKGIAPLAFLSRMPTPKPTERDSNGIVKVPGQRVIDYM